MAKAPGRVRLKASNAYAHRKPSTADTAKPPSLSDGRRVQSSVLSGRSCEATMVEEMERSLNALNEAVLVDYK